MRIFLVLAAAVLLAAHVVAAKSSSSSSSSKESFNVTKILAAFSQFSEFNDYLTRTHIADRINRDNTITVLALDNSAMDTLTSSGYSIFTMEHILADHILVDYYDHKKIHDLPDGFAQASSLFQSSGFASGTAGYVNITDAGGGSVVFTPSSGASSTNATFVKSVKEIPYSISILQISAPLLTAQTEAPAPSIDNLNLTAVMSAKGCALFAALVASTGDAQVVYQNNIEAGITVFCPVDAAVSAFKPEFDNLTADGQLACVLYHAIPIYESMQLLKTGNGVENTLASGGPGMQFNFTVQDKGESVVLETGVDTATITGTVIDEDPVACYTINKVLKPPQYFNATEVEAPAPAPAAAHKKKKHSPPSDQTAEAPGPDGATADDKASDQNAASRRSSFVHFSVALAATIATAAAVLL